MHRNYNIDHRLVACILLLSLFLQSCNNSPIPTRERSAYIKHRELLEEDKQRKEIVAEQEKASKELIGSVTAKQRLWGVASQSHLLAIPLLGTFKRDRALTRSSISPFCLSVSSRSPIFLGCRSSLIPIQRASRYSLLSRVKPTGLLARKYKEKIAACHPQEAIRRYSQLSENSPKNLSAINQTPYNTYSKAIKALYNNDPKTKDIDLSQERLTKKQFERLEKAIRNNSVLGYIQWGHVSDNCQKLREQIEKKLVQNICDYTYHPNDYIHGLLASHVYEDLQEGKEYEVDLHALAQKLSHKLPSNTKTRWKVIQVKDDSKKSGFCSALYVNETTHQAVLAFQGTKSILKDLVITDMQSVLGNAITEPDALAYEATKKAVEFTQSKGYNLSITGHSLGAYLAELAVAYCYRDFNCRQVKGIVFDSPGSYRKLNSSKPNVKNPGTEFDIEKLPITTYLSAPNPVNSCNDRSGEAYRLYPKLRASSWGQKLLERAGSISVVGPTIQTTSKGVLALTGHSLATILDLFDSSTGKPREYVRVGDWPMLKTDNLSYVGKQGALGAAIGRAVGSNIGPSLVGGEIGSFIGTRVEPLIEGRLPALFSLITVLADIPNLSLQQFWTALEPLDGDYRAPSLKPREEFRHKYVGHYREHPIPVGYHILKIDINRPESIDNYLYALWEDREEVVGLKTKDIISVVLNNILRDYTIVAIEGRLCLLSKQGPVHIQTPHDKIRRAIEVLSPERIKEALKNSKKQAIANYVTQQTKALPQLHSDMLDANLEDLEDYVSMRCTKDRLGIGEKILEGKTLEEKIHTYLNQTGICVVHAPGGMGKSTLVTKYGNDRKEQQAVRWISAETPVKLIQGYEKIAREIDINDEQLTQLKKDPDNYPSTLVQTVYNAIEKCKQPTLLILDNLSFNNVVDPTLIKACLLHRPSLVQVIVTTRDRSNSMNYNNIELDPFTEEEGREYIQKRLERLRPSEQDIEDLMKEVGRVPQKLDLATAYIREITFMTIKKYIRELKELKEEGKKQKGRLILPEVRLGLEILDASAQLVMRYGAYLDPAGIPKPLLTALLGTSSEEELHDILDPLKRLSLIKITNEPTKQDIKIHQEIQEACKEYQGWKGKKKWWWPTESKLSEQEVLETLLQTLIRYMPVVTESPDSPWDQARLYAKSVEHYAKSVEHFHSKTKKQLVGQDLLAGLFDRMGYYNHEVECDYRQALKHYQKALDTKRRLYGSNHKDIAASLNDIGIIYKTLGKNQEALEHYEQALKMYKDLHEDFDTAASLNNIAIMYKTLGQYDKADESVTESLEMYKKLYKGIHPDIAMTLSNRGSVRLNLAKYKEALEDYKEALEMLNKLLKEAKDVEETKKINKHIAMITHNIGSIYILSQPSKAASFDRIWIIYKALGKSYEQVQYFEEPILMEYTTYTPDIKSVEKALEELKKISESSPMYGNNSRDRAMTINNIASIYRNLSQHQEALKHYQQALAIMQALYGNHHPYMATLLNNIGAIYHDLGGYGEALEYYQQSIKMFEHFYSENHPEVQRVKDNISKLG